MTSTFQEYIQRRADRISQGVDLEKMRLGQQACEIFVFPSDPEIRCALVPLVEGEYRRTLELAEKLELLGNNHASNLVRDQVQKEMTLYFAAREITDLSKKFFDSPADVDAMDQIDAAAMFDEYLELTAAVSPSMMGMSEEDFQDLKTLLPRIAWSELSGPQWYAANRFLNLIQPLLRTVNLHGSSSTLKSTEESES